MDEYTAIVVGNVDYIDGLIFPQHVVRAAVSLRSSLGES